MVNIPCVYHIHIWGIKQETMKWRAGNKVIKSLPNCNTFLLRFFSSLKIASAFIINEVENFRCLGEKIWRKRGNEMEIKRKCRWSISEGVEKLGIQDNNKDRISKGKGKQICWKGNGWEIKGIQNIYTISVTEWQTKG